MFRSSLVRAVLFRAAVLRTAAALAVSAVAGAGCTPLGVAVGSAATVGTAALQERSMSDAMDDTEIKLGINDRLFKTEGNLFNKVSATVVEGRVLLAGIVDSEAESARAEDITWTVPGVREILNELQVGEEPTFMLVKDEWIATKLRARLFGDFDISDVNYDIEVVDGTVYLMGVGQDQFEIERAAAHAQEINGVNRVVVHALAVDDPRRTAQILRPAGAPAVVPFERQIAGSRDGSPPNETRTYAAAPETVDTAPARTASIQTEPLPPVR